MTSKTSAAIAIDTDRRSVLDAAIEQHQIPKWPYEAAYDRIVVYALPEAKATRSTFIEGGNIEMPASLRSRTAAETPRAVLVSAGLAARDVLRSHGMGLGHVLWVARLSPWRHVVDRTKDGRDIEFLFLRVGDIVGSETLLAWIAEGRIKTVVKDGLHSFEYADEGVVPRFDPPSYVG